jgi:cold shock CspA family protein
MDIGKVTKMCEGFCFARVDGWAKNVFVHRSVMLPRGAFAQVVEGSMLEMDVEDTPRGLRANSARVI